MPERLLPSYATRCPGWIGAGSRLGWVVLLATSVVGLLEASPTHAQDMAQVCQPLRVASASQIRLDVHDFISDAAGGLLSEELILQDAIADVLFLHFLVQPRLDVRRVPLLFRSTSQSAGIGQQAPQIEISGEGSRYVLEGKITFLQPLRSGQPGVPGPGKAKLLSLRYQLWEWTSPRKATIKLEGGVLVTTNELHERLQDVAMEVIAHLLPNRKVCLVIGPFRLVGFSGNKRRFYEANLPGLLRTTLLRSGFVKIVELGYKGAYELSETARFQDRQFKLQARLKRPNGTLAKPIIEVGQEEVVLDGQLQLTQKIIDTLRIEVESELSGGTHSLDLSVEEYLETARKYDEVDPQLAVVLYRRAYLLDPDNREARQALGRALLQQDQPEQVLEVLTGAVDPVDYMLRSFAYFSMNRDEDGIAELDRGVELRPKDRGYYKTAASVYEELGNYMRAVEVLEEGREHASEGEELSGLLNETRRKGAAALIRDLKPGEALPFALAAVKAEPQSEWGQRLVGISYLRLGSLDEAESHLRKAVEIVPTEYAFSELAVLRLKQKKRREARGFAQQAIELNAEWPNGYRALIDAVQEPAEAAAAVAWLKKYWSEHPSTRLPLQAWAEIQVIHLGIKPEDMNELYLAHKRALEGIAYGEWLSGWTNLVELAMLSGSYQDGANIAGGLLKLDLSLHYELNMRFYLWVTRLLLKECDQFGEALSAFADLLRQPKVKGFENQWIFEGTRQHLEEKFSEGNFDQRREVLLRAGLELVDSQRLDETNIQRFLEQVDASLPDACAAVPLTSLVADRTEKCVT